MNEQRTFVDSLNQIFHNCFFSLFVTNKQIFIGWNVFKHSVWNNSGTNNLNKLRPLGGWKEVETFLSIIIKWRRFSSRYINIRIQRDHEWSYYQPVACLQQFWGRFDVTWFNYPFLCGISGTGSRNKRKSFVHSSIESCYFRNSKFS